MTRSFPLLVLLTLPVGALAPMRSFPASSVSLHISELAHPGEIRTQVTIVHRTRTIRRSRAPRAGSERAQVREIPSGGARNRTGDLGIMRPSL